MFNVSLTQNCIKNQVNVGLSPVLFPHFAVSSVLRVAVPVSPAKSLIGTYGDRAQQDGTFTSTANFN